MSQTNATSGSTGASVKAIREHYDAGNDFFASWLDDSMTYSAARWSGGREVAEPLEQAQLRKLDWHLSTAGLKSAGRLLDIGCGWGSLMRRASEVRNIAKAIGLTPSVQQANWINAMCAGSTIQAVQTTWQNAKFDRPFDSIISIGAIEHFSKPGISTGQKRLCYEDFFRFCKRNLKSDGRVSIQFIAWMDIAPSDEIAQLPATLFPESNLPHSDEILQTSDPWFQVVELENRPADYSRTLQEWLRQLNNERDDLVREFGRDLVKQYLRGFRRFILGFENGTLGLYRIGLKPR